MNIAIGSDNAGVGHKTNIAQLIRSMGHTPLDVGTGSDESVDYPDFGEKGAMLVSCGKADLAILVCGTGIGISMAANKVKGIRAAVCWNKETARLAREHNDANALCMGARFMSVEESLEAAKVFLETPASKDPRHVIRVKKIMDIEERNRARE